MKMLSTTTLALAAIVTAASFTGAAETPADAAARHTVTLVATSESPATITAAGNGVVVQKQDRTSYKRVFTRKSYAYYSVSVIGDGGKVTCKILVDGKVKRSKSATGSFAYVDCTL